MCHTGAAFFMLWFRLRWQRAVGVATGVVKRTARIMPTAISQHPRYDEYGLIVHRVKSQARRNKRKDLI